MGAEGAADAVGGGGGRRGAVEFPAGYRATGTGATILQYDTWRPRYAHRAQGPEPALSAKVMNT